MTDSIETRGALRLSIELHEGPEPPYNEGGAPILRMDGGHVDQVTETTNYKVSPRVLEAANMWGFDDNRFIRYLHVFHGVTRTETSRSGRSRYFSFDPADWRELTGVTDELLTEHPDVNPADLSEWKAYCEGEVYGYVVERRVGWHRVADGSRVPDWDTVNDCWGFYGYENALEAGREALADADDSIPNDTVTVKVELTMTYSPADYRLAYGDGDDGAPQHMSEIVMDAVAERWGRMDWGTPTGVQVARIIRA